MPSSRKISRSSKPSAQSLKATPSARRTLIPKPPSLTPLGSARVSADGPDTMENRDLWSCSKDGSTSTPQNTAPLSPTQSHLCESDRPPEGWRGFSTTLMRRRRSGAGPDLAAEGCGVVALGDAADLVG